jgi:sulfur relay protein TusB/DsrH
MQQLHLVFNRNEALKEALRWAAEDDLLILIGDTCYALVDAQLVTRLQSTAARVLALASDLRCRGLSGDTAVALQLIEDEAWVALCAQYPAKSWY